MKNTSRISWIKAYALINQHALTRFYNDQVTKNWKALYTFTSFPSFINFRFSNLFAGGGTSSSANTSPKKSAATTPQEPINVWYGGGATNQNQTQMQRRHTLSAQPSRYSGADSGFEGYVDHSDQKYQQTHAIFV